MPASEELDDWGLGDAMRRGAAVVGSHVVVGEEAFHVLLFLRTYQL